MFNKKSKLFSLSERKSYYEGIVTAREDFASCKGDKKMINSCIKTRYGLRKLCKERGDKSGISFQNGYLKYFSEKQNNKLPRS